MQALTFSIQERPTRGFLSGFLSSLAYILRFLCKFATENHYNLLAMEYYKRLFIFAIACITSSIDLANEESVFLRNDTLFCNLSNNEIGTLKSMASSI